MKNYTDITCVIDRSGSMAMIANDTIGGFNSFIEDQKKLDGEALLSYIQFDHAYDKVYEARALQTVEPLTRETFQPRGNTALYDAVGRAIVETGQRFASMKEEERPEKVLFIILTDGGENASREYDRDKVFEMITHQKSTYNWQFIFLAANQDALQAAQSMGISRGNSLNFSSNGDSVRAMASSLSKATAYYRSAATMDFAEENETLFAQVGIDNSKTV